MKFGDVKKAQSEYKKRVKNGIFISLAITLIITMIISIASDTNYLLSIVMTALFVAIFVASFAFVIIIIASRKQAKAYKSAYKAYFVDAALKQTFTDIKYDHNLGLSKAILDATQMVNTGDVYSSNDLTTGKYKDVAFTQADVHIQEQHSDGDSGTTYVTIFKGRFMIFEFPKKFNFRLEVVEKWFGANRIPGKNKTTGRKFEKIQVESSEFNKIFKTYAEDGFEAFYLLDPAFIHNILELDQQYKGKLLLGFLDNKLLVGLKDGKDAFEPPSVFTPLDEKTETAKISNDIRLITNFVDKLKLNNKLFR